MDIFRFINGNSLTFFIVSANLLSISSLKTLGVCRQHDGSSRCCSNFRQEGQNCVPCVGSFGVNCSGRCADGFFGYGCLSRCNCSDDQTCDIIVGCTEDTIRRLTETTRLYHYIIIILSTIIICLIVALGAVSMRRKVLSSRQYQQELVNRGTSGEYASTEHQLYVSEQMLENISTDNQFQKSDSRSTHYEYPDPRSFVTEDKTFSERKDTQEIDSIKATELPLRADVWRSIKETVQKNRERKSVLRILSTRISLHDTNHRCSYVSVVDEQSTSCNAGKM